MTDQPIDHPDHYGGGNNPYEVIKILQAVLTPEEYQGFCKGNTLKYIMRAGKKGGASMVPVDLGKGQNYLDFALEALSSDQTALTNAASGITARMSVQEVLEFVIPLVKGEGSADLQSILEMLRSGKIQLREAADA